MFGILRHSLKTGVVTTAYPQTPAEVSLRARGRPEIDWNEWEDARPAAAVCPTGAISCADTGTRRIVRFDLGGCLFCGLCADTTPAIRMTHACECATRDRQSMVATAEYSLQPDGSHDCLVVPPGSTSVAQQSKGNAERGVRSAESNTSIDAIGQQIKERASRMFGRSLHIRQVDAGSCNGCEVEIHQLNSPVYDLERFGIHFVASPRHADMLLVTGPVTRNMELALRKTWDAAPDPRLVVAVGACGCSGGIFGKNYATCGAIDSVIPVDVYIPGCPPNPHALLHGILMAIDRLPKRSE